MINKIFNNRTIYPAAYTIPSHPYGKTIDIRASVNSLSFIRFRKHKRMVELLLEMTLQWTDPSLTWQPMLFRNQTRLTVPSSLLWFPDVGVLDLTTSPEQITPPLASVDYTGEITGTTLQRLTTGCDFSDPSQITCELRIGSRKYTKDRVVLDYKELEDMDIKVGDSRYGSQFCNISNTFKYKEDQLHSYISTDIVFNFCQINDQRDQSFNNSIEALNI